MQKKNIQVLASLWKLSLEQQSATKPQGLTSSEGYYGLKTILRALRSFSVTFQSTASQPVIQQDENRLKDSFAWKLKKNSSVLGFPIKKSRKIQGIELPKITRSWLTVLDSSKDSQKSAWRERWHSLIKRKDPYRRLVVRWPEEEKDPPLQRLRPLFPLVSWEPLKNSGSSWILEQRRKKESSALERRFDKSTGCRFKLIWNGA